MNPSKTNALVLSFNCTSRKHRAPRRMFPEGHLAKVVRMFPSVPLRTDWFPTLKKAVSAYFRNGEVHVEIEQEDATSIPASFLTSLTCTIDCPAMDISATSALVPVERNGKYLTLRSRMLRPQWNETMMPSAHAVIKIESPKGEKLQGRLNPLLIAAMKTA